MLTADRGVSSRRDDAQRVREAEPPMGAKQMVDGIIDITVTWPTPHTEMAGRMLDGIAAEWGCTQQETCERLQPAGACRPFI